MRRFTKITLVLCLLLNLALASTVNAAPAKAPSAAAAYPQIIGYFAQWGIYQRGYLVKNIDTSGSASKLTVVNYAFGNVINNKCEVGVTLTGRGDAFADYTKSFDAASSVDGVADTWDQPLRGNWNQLKELKAKYPNLKVLISLGGWTWSANFSDAALPANRSAFVASCIDAYIKGNLPVTDGAGGTGAAKGVFDGIDIDWEYPAAPGNTGNIYRPEDTANFTALLAEFRSQLDAQGTIDGKHYLLTIAAPGGVDKIDKIEVSNIAQYLDWMNLMSYDFHGAWDAQGPTNFQAPLYGSPNDPTVGTAKNYNADYAITTYTSRGMPAGKITLGIPFYGRGWTGVTNANNGLYQAATGPAAGTYEAGIEDYKVLKARGYPGFRDTAYTQAFWTFNGTEWWSYDDPTSITNKMNYVKSKGLLGAMAWELDGDASNGELLSAIYNGLQGGIQPTNTPTKTNTPGGPTNTPTKTATPTKTSTPGTGCPSPLWVRTAIYNNGNTVSWNNHEWKAMWWTQGEEPGTTGDWGVWRDQGACSGTQPTNTPVPPTATKTNTPVPPTVTKTNTPGPTPTKTNTPVPATATRTPVPPTATNTQSGVAAWAANTYYAAGTLVTYGGKTYKCLQSHTSLTGWEPPNVPALWQLQ
jgi:GH18 family chitinase/chitodextrinase